MPYRSLAVHLAPTNTALRRLQLATNLAETWGARLIGIGAADPDYFSLAASGMAGVLADRRGRDLENDLEMLQDRFLTQTKHISAQWRAALASPVP